MDDTLCLMKQEEIVALEKEIKFFEGKNGLRLAYHEYGKPGGKPMLFMHGSGSHLHASLWHKPAQEYGFHLVIPDRPGVGHSTFKPGWTLQEYAAELVALADYLGFGEFAIAGISGGGPSLMAVAHDYPERLKCVIDLACAMPVYTDKEMIKSLGFADKMYAKLGANLPLALFKFPFYLLNIMLGVMKSPASFANMFKSSLCTADKALFAEPDFQYLIMEDFKELFRAGATGPAYDAQTNYREWGFALEDIAKPIDVFHGVEDKFVPIKFSEYLAARAQNVTINRIDGVGHFYHIAYGYHILRQINEKYYT